jgi:hypothetical protein
MLPWLHRTGAAFSKNGVRTMSGDGREPGGKFFRIADAPT